MVSVIIQLALPFCPFGDGCALAMTLHVIFSAIIIIKVMLYFLLALLCIINVMA